MYYEITGIKEQRWASINLHMLVDYDSPKKLRDFLQLHEIIILGIKEALWDEKTFGKVRCIVSENGIETPMILKIEQPFDAAQFLFELWFEVINVSYVDQEIPAEKMQKILWDAKDVIESEIAEKELEIAEERQQQKNIYEDKELQKLQTIIEEILEYLEKLYPKIDGIVIPERITRLHKLEEDLRKQKMWRNPSKIKETLQILFKLLEKVNDAYFQKLQEDGKADVKLFSETQVLERELIKEYQKLKKSETVKILNIKPSKNDKYYIFFQKAGIYFKFLKKDFFSKSKDAKAIGYKLFDIVQLALVAIAVELWLYLWAQQIFAYGAEQQHIFIVLVHLGILAVLLYGLTFFRKKNLRRTILLFLGWIALYFVVSTVVTMNFGL